MTKLTQTGITEGAKGKNTLKLSGKRTEPPGKSEK